jgi:predicted lipoprotein
MVRHTRKNKHSSHSSSMKSLSSEGIPGRCCDATMHGLHHWYSEMFEKLGWMILAKDRGMTDKIHTYVNSLHRLATALEQKVAKVHDVDHKEDLLIMWKNTKILLEHAQKDFGV